MKIAINQATIIILNDMLSYESMEAGKYILYQEFILFLPCVRHIVSKLQLMGKEKSIEITVENELSANDSNFIYIFIDERKIEQVFRNLIGNSIKFTPRNGHIKIRVSKSLRILPIATKENIDLSTNEYSFSNLVSISFVDDGIGISPLSLESMFGEFNQIDPNRLQGGGGTGLGLHISKRIITQHQQGVLSVFSEGQGRGSTFTITIGGFMGPHDRSRATTKGISELRSSGDQLSVTEPQPHIMKTFPFLQDTSLRDGISSHSDVASQFPMPAPVVVVVDDSSMVRKMSLSGLRRSMDSANIERSMIIFKECEDGIGVVDLVQKDMAGPRSIRLIIIDNIMINMHGIEATRKIREMGYTGVIVALSGNVLVEDKIAFLDAGADKFIAKPLDHAELGALLTTVLDVHSRSKSVAELSSSSVLRET